MRACTFKMEQNTNKMKIKQNLACTVFVFHISIFAYYNLTRKLTELAEINYYLVLMQTPVITYQYSDFGYRLNVNTRHKCNHGDNFKYIYLYIYIFFLNSALFVTDRWTDACSPFYAPVAIFQNLQDTSVLRVVWKYICGIQNIAHDIWINTDRETRRPFQISL